MDKCTIEVVRMEVARKCGKVIAKFETRELANDYIKYMKSFNNTKYDYFIW